jgi:glutamyl-tRNA(Gln) amidotransferase subunit E
MYPETDVPPVEVDEGLLDVEIPELISERAERYSKILPEDLAWVMADSPYYKLFEEYSRLLQPSLVARIIHMLPSELKKDGVNIDALEERHFKETLDLIASERIAKEGAEEILRLFCENPSAKAEEILNRIGTGGLDQLESYIEELLSEKKEFVIERGESAFKPLMGLVMKEFRGKIDGKVIAETLQRKIGEFLENFK